MSNQHKLQSDQDLHQLAQDLLPLEQVQITVSLPDEARNRCLKLLEEPLWQVILNDQAEL